MLHLNGLKGHKISSIESQLRTKLTGSLCTDVPSPKKQNRGEKSVHRLTDSTPSYTLGREVGRLIRNQ